MNVRLPSEQEKIVESQLKAGRCATIEQVLDEALLALRARREQGQDAVSDQQREAVQEMLDFVKKHGVRLEGISVKELIQEGHRL